SLFVFFFFFFFSSRRRHTRFSRDWSSDVCSSDLSVKVTSVFLLSWGIYSYGCADGWWGAYNSVFSPEVTVGKNSYMPFFYDAENLFYSGDSRSAQNIFKEENIADWKNYLEKLATEETIALY